MIDKEGRGNLYLPQRRIGGGGRAIASRQDLLKPCPQLSIINGSLPSPTGRNAAAHCMQQGVANDGGRVMGDGSRLVSSESLRRWGGRLVTYGGDARRF